MEIISIFVSVAAFTVSLFTFKSNSESSILAREVRRARRILAARCVLLWDQYATLIQVQRQHGTVDPFLYANLRRNALALLESLEQCASLGLTDEIRGDTPIKIHNAFLQGLQQHANMPKDADDSVDRWTQEHAIMGALRLVSYLRSLTPAVISDSQYSEMAINPDIYGRAKTYYKSANQAMESA